MTTTLTMNGGTGDCWCNAFTAFNDTGVNDLYVGSYSGDDDAQLWIPFVLNLAKSSTIISATVTVKASVTSSVVTSNVSAGCEAADSPSAPTTAADLRSRTMTGASTVTLVQYVANTTYNYDITTALQNVVNRSGWASGNTVAFMLRDVDTVDKPHILYSAHTANPPILTVVVPSFIPRGGMS